MKIAELEELTGVPIGTLKYYIREGLLPKGELSFSNQAQYNQFHIDRVKHIKLLQDIGGLSISKIKEIIKHLDSEVPDRQSAFQQLMLKLRNHKYSEDNIPDNIQNELDKIKKILDDNSWNYYPNDPVLLDIAVYVTKIKELWKFEDKEVISDSFIIGYLKYFRDIAKYEMPEEYIKDTESWNFGMTIISTLLIDPLFPLLRRLAIQDRTIDILGK